MPTPPALDTVAVIGGSVAGLLAAAAVAPHARRVVVLDRDVLPAGPATRPGTPHARHSHALLASGRASIEHLLPGFTDQVIADGGISNGDLGRAGRWWIGGGLISDCDLGVRGLGASASSSNTSSGIGYGSYPPSRFMMRWTFSACGARRRG